MMNKRNILIGIVIIVFGLVFVPRVIDRVKNNDISRSESRSLKLDNFEKNIKDDKFLVNIQNSLAIMKNMSIWSKLIKK